MPTLFISYKRGTTAVAPLMDKLRAAGYRLWFDRDEIHLGDPDWQARIDQGVTLSDGLVLNITPAACTSEPVRYEVQKARELGKPIFPIILERIPDYDAAIRLLGLPEKAHIEDFTDVTRWDEQVDRLLRDLATQGLRVTRHDRRKQRDPDNPSYVLHQQYLKRLVERIGTLNLAQITPEGASGINLEDVYVDSPTPYSISVEIKDWQVIHWWIDNANRPAAFVGGTLGSGPFGAAPLGAATAAPRMKPQELGYSPEAIETLIQQVDTAIARFRAQNPEARPDEAFSWSNPWKNGEKENVLQLHLNHLAAARDRLVVLGAPGSGKSTFVRFLALCLAGSSIDSWSRPATTELLDNWVHGALTPIYVELRRFVASPHFPKSIREGASADHLWNYICAELLGTDLQEYANDLQYDLEHGHAVLILDGLDEVPYPEGQLKLRQAQLIALAQSLNTRYSRSRVLVTSRPYAYKGWKLPGFEAVTITAFKDEHRRRLAERLYIAAGADAKRAGEQAQALNATLRTIDPELKDRPLFVTLMAAIYLKNGAQGLPIRRGALYRESILLLLGRWTARKPGMPSLLDILGEHSLEDLLTRLAALAFDVHANFGQHPGTPEIDEALLYRHLKPLGRSTAAELIPYLSENAGVLVSPGQNEDKDVFHFAHRTFQEYLAAAHLIAEGSAADSYEKIRSLLLQQPQQWRIPCTLAGDVLADTERRSDLWNLIDDLIDDDIPETITKDDVRWWGVWLSAVIVEEQKLDEQANLRRGERAIRDSLGGWLIKLVETAQALPPPERARCGRALGALGDSRKGVGLRPDGLPDIDWVLIPDDGEWVYQKGKHPPLPAFSISRYPITYAQFEAFATASDFNDDRWWAGMPEEQEAGGKTYRTRELSEQTFRYDNHPRETVGWYQAVAFCRWLSDKLGYEVTLPTEQQWEKAARGTDAREYPYKGAFDAAKGNTDETGIRQTSAVGIFPEGRSPYEVHDLSGNVLEWCLNKVDEPEQIDVDESGDSRVLRGGSWYSNPDNARAVSRRNYLFAPPANRDFNVGFRVVAAFVPSQKL